MELLSDEGFRFDGRRAAEFRKIQGRLGVFDHADGSAILQQVNLANHVIYCSRRTEFGANWAY